MAMNTGTHATNFVRLLDGVDNIDGVYLTTKPKIGDITKLSDDQLEEVMAKLLNDLTEANNYKRKLKREKEVDPEMLDSILKTLYLISQDMSLITKTSGVGLFYYGSDEYEKELEKEKMEKNKSLAAHSEETTSDSCSGREEIPTSMEEENLPSCSKRRLEEESEPKNENQDDYTLVTNKRKKKNIKKTNLNPDNQMDINEVPQIKIKKTRVPPISIVPPKNWQILITTIKSLAPSAHSKMSGRFLKISFDNVDDHRAVQRYLIQENVQFKTYVLEDAKPLKVVLRGLPLNTDVQDIKRALEFEDILEATVTQMYRGPVSEKKYLPLFHVSIPQKSDVDRIFQIVELMDTEVSFEHYRGKKGPSQCHNCQGFFHSALACNLPSRCVKCAGNHKSRECVKDFDSPCCCVHCGGSHPANFRNCPKFPKTTLPKQDRQNQIISKNSQNSKRTFSNRKVDNALSFAGAASRKQDVVQKSQQSSNSMAQSTPAIQNLTPVPAQDAFSASGFIQNLIEFQKAFSADTVSAAFQKSLPALRSASTEIDRIFILYQNILLISKIG